MADRPVTFDDMIAWCARFEFVGYRLWWQNRLADGAGTKTTTFGTSAGAADGNDRASAAVTPTPPSDGTTGSGAGSIAAAVDALRVALAKQRETWPDAAQLKLIDSDLVLNLRYAADALLALDVSGKIAAANDELHRRAGRIFAAESDAAKLRGQLVEAQSDAEQAIQGQQAAGFEINRLREQMLIERGACDTYRKWHTWYGALCRFVGDAVDHRCDLCKAHDTRRAAEKTTGDSACNDATGASGTAHSTSAAAGPRPISAEAKKDAHYAAETRSAKLDAEIDRLHASLKVERQQREAAQAYAKTWESNFHDMAANANRTHEALRVEREACDALRKGCDRVLDLINESQGVAWLHLNGDVAEWDSLISGNFHEWLSEFDTAVKQHDTRRAAEKQINGGRDPKQADNELARHDTEPLAAMRVEVPSPPTNNQAGNPAESRSDGSASGRGDDQPGGATRSPVLPVRPPAAQSPGDQPSVRGLGADGREVVKQSGDDGGSSQAAGGQGRSGAGASGEGAHPVQVTDEDRRMAEEWNDIYGMWYWNVKDVARLIAKVRHELDGKLSRIASILSDTTLESPQKIGRALRVAEGKA